MIFTALLSVFLLLNIHGTRALVCLDCARVHSARDCTTVKQCGPHEVCYSSSFVDSSGQIFRELGCKDRLQCTDPLVGKRSVKLRATRNLLVCDGCCDTQWCQTGLCNDVDYATDRGPICYNCQDQLPDEFCTQITECSRDSTCFESYKRSPSGYLFRQTGCFSKQLCQRIMSASNFRITNDTCMNCCESDICNTSCDLKKNISPTPTSIGSVPVTSATCVDSTSHDTCQVASVIACADIDHARNANCMHEESFPSLYKSHS